MQFPFQLLDPPAVLSGLCGADRPRLTEAGDRILLPGVQLCGIQPLLAPPGAPRHLVHCRGDDHCLQSCYCRPALAASDGSAGQGVGPPTLQRRHVDPNLTGHTLHR